MSEATLSLGIVLFTGVTALDFVGPAQILSEANGFSTMFLAKNLDPVATDAGFAVVPSAIFDECPSLDIIFLPGGSGQQGAMEDSDLVDFVRKQGATAKFVCSVCTGSLLLGKAGLLDGFRATTHWAFLDDLARFGAQPVRQRVVVDRNRVTGAGVSAGIDFALSLLAKLRGDDRAKLMQLGIEYDPEPPFDWGNPDNVDPVLVSQLRDAFRKLIVF
ncbi:MULTISPECIES: DJ-1/PfpI family protein [unclassified Sphingopyxis]|uniref:DJ-1/PfpI family protein n=1 Tax=unclassified Sphingopyxis TaxID=2614943 RepID=UPI0024AD579A|nr:MULTISPECIES: DJ-1/PfpI family protein [unclassified Sphingopyxis]